MMTTAHRIPYRKYQAYSGILMLSAWGFALVIASFLFLWLGYKIDEYIGTTPNFMFGLFFLAIFICMLAAEKIRPKIAVVVLARS